MAILLWVRTNRHVDTLGPEINNLRLALLGYSNQSYDWLEPFLSGDHVLFGIRTDAQIYGLKAFLGDEMKRDFIVDWSLTEVGRGLGPVEAHLAKRDDGTLYFDDRFIDPNDHDTDEFVKQADQNDFSVLDWGLPYDPHGATGLWLSLNRERSENDPLLRRVERCLPRPYQRMWQGRTSILFAYNSRHDFSGPAPFGISEELDDLVYDDQIGWFLAFQIGNASVGGALENMNPMADWIWRQRPRNSRQNSRRKNFRKPAVVEVNRRGFGVTKKAVR